MSKSKLGPIQTATAKHDLCGVMDAIVAGDSVDKLDQFGRSPLFYACKDGLYDIAVELIRHGASLDMRDKSGETPLHFAARSFQPAMITLLLDNGAQVDPRDNFGNTPLWRGVFTSQGRGEVVRTLLSAGADKDAKNESGVSPYELAKSIANYNTAEIFDKL